jgi:hypothetical protein
MVPLVMFPILKRQNEALALGYVVFRGALETAIYIAMAAGWMALVVMARPVAGSRVAFASQLGALQAQMPMIAILEIVFSLGALMFYYLLFRSRLIPRWLSGWGIVAAIPYLAAGVITMFGTAPEILMAPMFLQEMVLAVWLIARGFNTPPVVVRSRKEMAR